MYSGLVKSGHIKTGQVKVGYFVGFKNFMDPKHFWNQNLFDYKKFCTHKFSGPKHFKTRYFLGIKILRSNCFRAKYLEPKTFGTNIFGTNTFLDPHFFGQTVYWPNIWFDAKQIGYFILTDKNALGKRVWLRRPNLFSFIPLPMCFDKKNLPPTTHSSTELQL